jgi:hypothetical protein
MTKYPIHIRELTNIQISDIDKSDHPDYCDAFIESARWLATGEFLSEEELDRIDPQEAHKLILLRAQGA